MRIFISYASERRAEVEPLVHSLRNRGHTVFFDQDDLPAGQAYDERIEKAIRRSDMLIFVITPESVSPGRFTLSELHAASKKWRRASGRVLPVMLDETDLQQIPAYLRSLHIMRPVGSLSAEVSSEVAAIAASRRKRVIAGALLTIAVLVLGLTFLGGDRELPSEGHANTASVGPAFPLPRLGGSVPEIVAAADDGFLLGVSGPNELMKLSPSGDILASVRLAGAPADVSFGPLGWYIATRAPNEILRIDPEALEILDRLSVRFPADVRAAFDEPASYTPASVAQDDTHLWLITRDGGSGAVLSFTTPTLETLVIPPYFDEVSFDIRDQHLRSGADVVWGTQTDTLPASLYNYRAESWDVFEGHDFDALACASDVSPMRSFLVLPDCDQRLKLILPADGRIEVREDLGPLPRMPNGADTWEEYRLIDRGNTVIAVANLGNVGQSRADRFVIAEVFRNEPARIILQGESGFVLDIAGDEQSLLVILQLSSGARELRSLAL